ncbi:MAG: phosphatidate cytidylyltransferase [Planctomycetota bacterium]|nr:phosphatidate cytidylyltransferase [Planctomycetota bacterium]
MQELLKQLTEHVGSIYLNYLLAISAVLLGAGFLLSSISICFGKPLSSVWKTYRSWLYMAPLILLTLYLGREATIVSVTLLSFLGVKEYARATGLYEDWWYMTMIYIGLFAVALLVSIPDPGTGALGWYGFFMALPVFAIEFIIIVPIARNKAKGQLQPVALSILGFIYLGWMFGHLGFLANSQHGQGYLLFLCFAVPISDVAAFTSGKLFGKNKLRDQISPKKTWGGSIGSFAVSMALPWLLHFSFPHFGWVELVLTGIIVGIGGQLGDLTMSFIKRDLGIKDMGTAIPGHGGLLDRLDSLIFVAPLFFHMARWFHDL